MTFLRVDREAVQESLANVQRHLLDARKEDGHWEGELSSSALATATASFALWLYSKHPSAEVPRRDVCTRLSASGVRWMTANQNPDGGWGDTPDSVSNLSTTALCWATLHAFGGDSFTRAGARRADAWLTKAAGSLEPGPLAEAIARQYGKDRTFSVPILTLCALAGQLGTREQAWRLIPQLPFELAALPQSLFRFLRLPVVSYALPALIAMGQVHHYHCPTRNPILRLIRSPTSRRARQVLRQIQPPGGGFLEATPLTSFVVMSLIASGGMENPVTAEGLEFLIRSVRLDGSWPIDTNLATWVTTLSLNALAAGGRLPDRLNPDERRRLHAWLLGQQYRVHHPYTGAAPGGWAWTDLPGGVPDADDTAGALIALRHLGEPDAAALDAAKAGVRWLLDLQNSDGGIPTFCRGWGHLPFDRSSPELTVHALAAWEAWTDLLPARLSGEVGRAIERGLRSLRSQQRPDGCWIPLWFGNQAAPDEGNPAYGTSRVVTALCRSKCGKGQAARELANKGIAWLLAAQGSEGGWGGAPGLTPSVEETGHALQALSAAYEVEALPALGEAIARGTGWLIRMTGSGNRFQASPVGLYFAKLWYSEQLYPLIATAGALGLVSRVWDLLPSFVEDLQ